MTSIRLLCAVFLFAMVAGSVQAQDELEDMHLDELLPVASESAPAQVTPIPFIPADPPTRSRDEQPSAPPRPTPRPAPATAWEAPPSPSDFNASVRSSFVVRLSWTDNGGDADRVFQVAVSADGASIGSRTIQPDHNPNTNRVITEIVLDKTRVRYCFELWAQSGPSLRSASITECVILQPPSRQTAPPGRGRPWR